MNINYLSQGINAIAVNESKVAIFPWKVYQTTRITEEELARQQADPKARGIAIICGAISGNLEVIDIDTKYETFDLWNAIDAKIPQNLRDKLHIVRTRSGGVHLVYRCEFIEGNQKLANRHVSNDEAKANPHLKFLTIIETRGEGGYVVAPPTSGYEVISGNGINVISVDEREELFEIMRSFNEVIEEVIIEAHHRPSPKDYGKSPFEDYNQRGDISSVLVDHGWEIVRSNSDRVYYLRPGGTSEHSGSYNKALGLFSVFSTNTPFVVGKGYRPVAVFCTLECGGDYSLAAKKLLDMGYGEKKTSSRIEAEVYHKKNEGYDSDEIIEHLVKKMDLNVRDAKKIVERAIDGEKEPVLTFWDCELKGKQFFASINRYKLQSYLTNEGGFKLYFYDNNGTDFRLVREKDGFVRESSTEEIKKFIKGYLDSLEDDLGYQQSPQTILELVYKGASVLFSDAFFEFFDRANIDFLVDTKDVAYFPFKNGVIVVSADEIVMKTYGELNKVIWESQVIDHNVVLDQDVELDKIEYYKFLRRISGDEDERTIYALSLIGYLLHKYKDPSKPFSVILAEETDTDAKGGGTGKGIFVKALGYMVNLVKVDGKNFKIDKNFAFQRVDLDTRILAIEDTRKNVDFEGFYSVITEGITVEKKNKDELFIPYKDSPKVMFTTNYTIPNNGNHAKRRQKVLEFSPYFGAERTPEQEFGHQLFVDWDKDEWNRFYNLMFDAVQGYLKYGVMAMESSEKLNKKQVKVQFGEEFFDYFEGLIDSNEEWVSQEQLYNDFLKMANFEKKDYSVKRFAKAIEESCTILKIAYIFKRDRCQNNRKVYKFSFIKESLQRNVCFLYAILIFVRDLYAIL